MSTGVVLLVAGYVLIALLLLSLNLRSAWPWWVKAGGIVVTALFFGLTFVGLQALMGLPTRATPPEHFRLHAALVEEPDEADGEAGAIFLWLTPKPAGERADGPPRAFALPYSRELHEMAARARTGMAAGRPVEGEARARAEDGTPLDNRSLRIELYEAPAPDLPPK